MADSKLKAELDELRREIGALKAERAHAAAAAGADAGAEPEPDTGEMLKFLQEQLAGLARALGSFADGTEDAIAAHSVTAVVGALVAGFLVGRLVGR